jgi:hypothetical protein
MDNTVASTMGMSVKGIRYLVESLSFHPYLTIRQSNLSEQKTAKAEKVYVYEYCVLGIRSNS